MTLFAGYPGLMRHSGRNLFPRRHQTARQQGAPVWELRGALSVAQLRLALSREDQAGQILAPTYGEFTEGFETADPRNQLPAVYAVANAVSKDASFPEDRNRGVRARSASGPPRLSQRAAHIESPPLGAPVHRRWPKGVTGATNPVSSWFRVEAAILGHRLPIAIRGVTDEIL
jgi:hypothetical protein